MKVVLTILLVILVSFIILFIYFLLGFPFTKRATLDFENLQAISIEIFVEDEHKEIVLTKSEMVQLHTLLKSDYTNIFKQDISDRGELAFRLNLNFSNGQNSCLLCEDGILTQLNYFLEPRFQLHNAKEVIDYLQNKVNTYQ